MGRHVETESFTEAVAGHLLFRDDDVVRLVPQPFWIERIVEGRPGWACPDFLVERSDGRLAVVEVKRALYRPADSTLIKLAAVRQSCEQLDLGFRLVTGLSQSEQAIFDLLQTFHSERCITGPGTDELKELVIERASAPTPLEDLWSVGPAWQTKPMIWWMLWHNILCMDWSSGLDRRTLVLAHSRHTSDAEPDLACAWTCGPAASPTIDDLWSSR
ncbi:hypothetical protein [Nocardioides aromaticivorans]|nr:hypothetical protein [Nocardioides aromaticivorans]